MTTIKPLIVLAALSATMCAAAQTDTPNGAYEAAEKAEGQTRQGYLEINTCKADVPDFTQTFTRGEEHTFKTLPSDFMKKPPRRFAGRKAHGFVKIRSKFLISNTETCMLSEPVKTDYGYTLSWESDYGKKGKCELHVENDSTLYFIGLGSLGKSIGPDSLKFIVNRTETDNKKYLACGTKPTPGTPGDKQAKPQDDGPRPKADKQGNIIIPTQNSGTLKDEWAGASRLIVNLNSTAPTYTYYGHNYYGIIKMDGPGYIHEGVTCIQQAGQGEYLVYSTPLDTDAKTHHWSRVKLYSDGSISFYPTGGVNELDQMGRERKKIYFYWLTPKLPQYSGKFTTNDNVIPFPVDFYEKKVYDDGYGGRREGYGCIVSSPGGSTLIDNDFITEASILADGRVAITYICGRTDATHKAVLTYDKAKNKYDISVDGDTGDCFLPNFYLWQTSKR